MKNTKDIDIKSIIEKMHFLNMMENKIRIQIPDSEKHLEETVRYFIGDQFVWLPEYRHVAEWLNDNQGLGLCLYGQNGTGKTILVQKAIPVLLFRFCAKTAKCFNYYDRQDQQHAAIIH